MSRPRRTRLKGTQDKHWPGSDVPGTAFAQLPCYTSRILCPLPTYTLSCSFCINASTSLVALLESGLGWCSAGNRDTSVPGSCSQKPRGWHCPRKLEGRSFLTKVFPLPCCSEPQERQKDVAMGGVSQEETYQRNRATMTIKVRLAKMGKEIDDGEKQDRLRRRWRSCNLSSLLLL